jgi:hypothetical protein
VPSLPLGHEKWFVDAPGAFHADWAFARTASSLALIAAVAGVALVWHLVGARLPRPELLFLEPLGRLAPWVPRLLGIHLGVSLLSLAVRDAYLAPNLSLEHVPGGAAIAFAEGLLGVWFITGAWLRPAGLVTLLLGPLAALLAAPVRRRGPGLALGVSAGRQAAGRGPGVARLALPWGWTLVRAS